jgi:ABC-type transporter Mla subunit MlaD
VEGHDELVVDGESGLVVGFDDVPGAARALDTLARDRELLARLRDGALRRAAALPTVEAEAASLLEALSAAPATTDRPQRLLLNARAVAEPIAQERRALDLALRSYEDRIEALTGENDRLRTELEAARRGLLERIRRRA